MNTVDTRREAIESLAAALRLSDWSLNKVAADTLLALLSERDALTVQRDVAWHQLKVAVTENSSLELAANNAFSALKILRNKLNEAQGIRQE